MSSQHQGFLRNLRIPAGLFRVLMNLWPPFVGAGIRVLRIDPDYRYVRVRLTLGLLNRNAYGTQYGGSLFSMTDPFYALMLAHNLGPGYTVWDRAAAIRFIAPGRSAVFAEFRLDGGEIERARRSTAGGSRYEPTFSVAIVDVSGALVATVDKTLYIRGPAAPG